MVTANAIMPVHPERRLKNKPLIRVFSETGIEILQSDYVAFPPCDPDIYDMYHYDGREWVGLVVAPKQQVTN